jgi:hypothetical protein
MIPYNRAIDWVTWGSVAVGCGVVWRLRIFLKLFGDRPGAGRESE